jgi:glutamine amidotransferase
VIALLDYGAGDLICLRDALTALGAEVLVPREPNDLVDASGVIVPGAGHFQMTGTLDEGWRDAILNVIGEGRPLLGICLGMQWLFDGSREAPDWPGLGLMSGRCERLDAGIQPAPAGVTVNMPHVGWNSLHLPRQSHLLQGVDEGARVYFTHSYAAPVSTDCVAVTTHIRPFAAAVERGQVSGVQFHPEKSGEIGLQVLRNFLARAF